MSINKYSYLLLSLFFQIVTASPDQEIARKIVYGETIEQALVEKQFDEKNNGSNDPFKTLEFIAKASDNNRRFEIFGREICEEENILGDTDPNLVNLNTAARASHILGTIRKFQNEYEPLLDKVINSRKEQAEKRIDEIKGYVKIGLIGNSFATRLRRDIVVSNLIEFMGGNTEDFENSLRKADPDHKLLESKKINEEEMIDSSAKKRRLS